MYVRKKTMSKILVDASKILPDIAYARIIPVEISPQQWKLIGQPLATHLKNVKNLTGDLVPTHLKEMGLCAGAFHDIAKDNKDWQQYLKESVLFNIIKRSPSSDVEVIGDYLINVTEFINKCRLSNKKKLSAPINHALDSAKIWATQPYDNEMNLSAIKFAIASHHKFDEKIWYDSKQSYIANDRTKTSYFSLMRYLWACLVDSDRLDAQSFNDNINNGVDSTAKENKCIPQNQSQLQGYYSITMPTGAGKTRKYIELFLENQSQFDVLIVATGRIKLTDQVYKELPTHLQEQTLIHHSDVPTKDDSASQSEHWRDHKVILTTLVQLAETLRANTPGKLRKLPRLKNALIVLDEPQCLDVEDLALLILQLDFFVTETNCSVVSVSATQPNYFKILNKLGNPFNQINIKELIPANVIADLYAKHDRRKFVCLNYRQENSDEVAYQAIADTLIKSKHKTGLIVFNTRKKAQEAFRYLSKHVPGTWYHLSRTMCAAHRHDTMQHFPTSSKDWDNSCFVVATRIISVGHNYDFPIVFQEADNLVNLLQGAGRCDRFFNMLNPTVYCFAMPSTKLSTPEQSIWQDIANLTTLEAIDKHNNVFDDQHCANLVRYFTKGDFVTLATKKVIEPEYYRHSVIVPYGVEGESLWSQYNGRIELSRSEWRSAQPFVVDLNYFLTSKQQYVPVTYDGTYCSKLGAISCCCCCCC